MSTDIQKPIKCPSNASKEACNLLQLARELSLRQHTEGLVLPIVPQLLLVHAFRPSHGPANRRCGARRGTPCRTPVLLRSRFWTLHDKESPCTRFDSSACPRPSVATGVELFQDSPSRNLARSDRELQTPTKASEIVSLRSGYVQLGHWISAVVISESRTRSTFISSCLSKKQLPSRSYRSNILRGSGSRLLSLRTSLNAESLHDPRSQGIAGGFDNRSEYNPLGLS